MAIMKLTAFNGGMKGKVGGTIFQSGKAGQIVKNNSNPFNAAKELLNAVAAGSKLTKADAGRGLLVKQFVSRIATHWRTLSTADRLTWNTGAVNFPFKNKFGDIYTPSGFQVFMSINIRLAKIGYSMLSVIPAAGGLLNASPFTVNFDAALQALNISATAAPTGYIQVLSASRPVSKGIIFPVNGFADIYQFDGSESFPFDFSNWYSNYFGTIPLSGTIWFKLTIYNSLNGQPGTEQYFQLTY